MDTPVMPRIYPMPRGQRGVSLVELMISLAIGLVLLLGITSLIVQQSSTRDELEKSSRQIENGRYAMELLRNDIQHAGFYGHYFPLTNVTWTTPDPCADWNLGWNAAIPQVAMPIYGYPGAGLKPVTCLDNYQPNTAVLVIRRTDTKAVPGTAPVPGVTYLQASACSTENTPFVLGTGGFNLHNRDCTTAPPGTLAPLNPYLVRIYYISSCNVCTPSDRIPTLKVVENGGPATPLVEGIENMQFDYGIDYLPAAAPDGSPDCYFTDPTTPPAWQITQCEGATGTPGSSGTAATNWGNVMTVRVNLLARNTECSTGHAETKTYRLSGLPGVGPVVLPANDCVNGDYKRHVFSALVRAVNPSGRRAPQ